MTGLVKRSVDGNVYTCDMSETASIRELRDNLADIVDRASHNEVTTVTRRGRPVAAVVPIALVDEWRRWEEERVIAMIDESLADPCPSVPMSDVLAETLARPE